MARRPRRRPESGAEALEFIASLGLVAVVVTAAIEAVTLTRLQAAAEIDARAVARLAALCAPSRPADLAAIDPGGTRGASLRLTTEPATVTADVWLAPEAVLPAVRALGWRPHATVTMAREPGCERG